MVYRIGLNPIAVRIEGSNPPGSTLSKIQHAKLVEWYTRPLQKRMPIWIESSTLSFGTIRREIIDHEGQGEYKNHVNLVIGDFEVANIPKQTLD